MKYFILLIALTQVFAATSRRLPKEYRGKSKEDIQKMLMKRQSDNISNVSSAIKKQKKVVKFEPFFEKDTIIISSLETFAATITDNIVSSGRRFSLPVYPDSHFKIPEGSYFECEGVNWAQKYDYRVDFTCSKLITPNNEFKINASVIDEYKIPGVLADEVYDGSEESILGTAVAAGFQTMLGGIASTEQTDVGTRFKVNAGNTVVSGVQGGVSAANDEMLTRSQERNLILRVNKNKKVFIRFKERFSYEL